MEIDRSLRQEDTPETKALWAAVLIQAKMDLHAKVSAKLRKKTVSEIEAARRDAAAWLEASNDDPFSFSWVCDHLNLDTHHVKQRIYARG